MYESAINMEKKYFFKNFGSILMYAVAGTLISCIVVAFCLYLVSLVGWIESFTLDTCFLFGSAISATDHMGIMPIFKQYNADQNLVALKFGEVILNSAVSIILYDSSIVIRDLDGTISQLTWYALVNFLEKLFGSMCIGCLIGMISAYVFYFIFLKWSKH